MTESEFSQAANDIATFLGAPAPTATKIFAWMPKVERIPSEALPYIVAKITDEVDAMPRNLPKVFKEKFRAWQMENPGKVAVIEQQGCRDCESGVLFLERTDERGDVHTGCIFCQCYQGSAGYLGRSTLAYMERQGWRSTKAKTIGPGCGNKADIAAQLSRARQDERRPDPARYDGYEDQFAEGW